MRGCLCFVFMLTIVTGCNKQAQEHKALMGNWVEKTNRLDTLVVYRSNGKDLMFDNSLHFRSFPTWASNYAFRYEFKLNGDKIGFRSADSQGDFLWYDFRWQNNDEFTMRYNGLRPYLSSIGDITYVRLK